jgi:transcriptional regulator with XRE-family HTH domain
MNTKEGAALRAFLMPAVRPSDVARAAGVSRQYVSAVLSGKRRPSARIVRAADELGLPVRVIFGDRIDSLKDPTKSASPAPGGANKGLRGRTNGEKHTAMR